MIGNTEVEYKQVVLDSVPDKWDKAYKNSDGTFKYGADKQAISIELNKLSKPLLESDINRIANSSWTRFECDTCREPQTKLLSIEPISYDSYENPGIIICAACLRFSLDKLLKD